MKVFNTANRSSPLNASSPWAKSETAYRQGLPGALRPSGALRRLAAPADLWWPYKTRLCPCRGGSCSSRMGPPLLAAPGADSSADCGRWFCLSGHRVCCFDFLWQNIDMQSPVIITCSLKKDVRAVSLSIHMKARVQVLHHKVLWERFSA